MHNVRRFKSFFLSRVFRPTQLRPLRSQPKEKTESGAMSSHAVLFSCSERKSLLLREWRESRRWATVCLVLGKISPSSYLNSTIGKQEEEQYKSHTNTDRRIGEEEVESVLLPVCFPIFAESLGPCALLRIQEKLLLLLLARGVCVQRVHQAHSGL
jgi:hypothetical protein